MQTEWCTVPKPEWMKVTTQQREKMVQTEMGRKREKEKSSYFTPMQHAEEIQLPFKLQNPN